MTLTPWKTPLYKRGASFFDCSSPCSCKLIDIQISRVASLGARAYLPDFDSLERMSDGDSSASSYTSGDECTVIASALYSAPYVSCLSRRTL